ncbi:hypothetical protein [Luteimonas sp. e5]
MSRLLSFATLALLIAGGSALAQDKAAKKLYCWDENGRRVCGDALPASAVDSARTEISARSGLPGAHIGRAPTAAERAALAEQAEAERLRREQAAAEARRDLALAESYESEDALRQAYRIRYELVDEGLKTSKMAIDNQQRSLLRLLQAAADAELKGGKVPDRLAQNVLTQRASVLDARRAHALQQAERVALDRQLAEAITRYRKARGLDAADEAAPPASAARP